MNKIKITKEQRDRLFSQEIIESHDVQGGINRVNNSVKKELSGANIQNLDEDDFNVRANQSGIPNSSMKIKQEIKPIKRLSEDNTVHPDLEHAIARFIENVWMNPRVVHYLDKPFKELGLSLSDITKYLASTGVLSVVGVGQFKVNNMFKRRYSDDNKTAMHQKIEDIQIMAKQALNDPKAPWNANKGGESKTINTEESNYPAGTENDPNSPWNQQGPKLDKPTIAPKMFKPVEMGKEIAILNASSGMYIFDYADIDRNEFPNTSYELTIDDIADYVNANLAHLSKGDGLDGFNAGAQLVLIDEPLKNELIDLYSYDKKFVSALSRLEEMTSAASSGAFTGPLSGGKSVEKGLTPSEELMGEDETIEETTTTASSGSYVQPQIWAKNKANWKAGASTQYPNGEMVNFDSCTKLNNNKSAQKGKCSTGAINNVVKTHKTSKSVISPSLSENAIYETIAKKTGRKIEEIKTIITNKDKSLT